jgi:hypothetical protein
MFYYLIIAVDSQSYILYYAFIVKLHSDLAVGILSQKAKIKMNAAIGKILALLPNLKL